jgi:hypothetical protein
LRASLAVDNSNLINSQETPLIDCVMHRDLEKEKWNTLNVIDAVEWARVRSYDTCLV